MPRAIHALSLFALLALTPAAAPQDRAQRKEVPDWSISLAEGVVVKVDKDSLTIEPRGPGGKARKEVTLALIGTSHISLAVAQKEGEKVMLTQREATVKDLQPGQGVAVIYTTAGSLEKPVLLSAVAQPVPGK